MLRIINDKGRKSVKFCCHSVRNYWILLFACGPPLASFCLFYCLFKQSAFKNVSTPAYFCLFSVFSKTILHKNCWLRQESNSDCRSRRQARGPLDHHHGQAYNFYLKNVKNYPSTLLVSSIRIRIHNLSFSPQAFDQGCHVPIFEKHQHWILGFKRIHRDYT